MYPVMGTDTGLTKDSFILPYDEKYRILFLPLENKIYLVDADFVKSEILYRLLVTDKDKSGFPIRNNRPEVPCTDLELELTNSCNLRCVYCYSENRRRERKNIKESVAKDAVDYFITRLKGTPYYFNLGFFGSGESTLNWNLLTTITEYAREECKENDVKLNVTIGNTNGTTFDTESKIQWVVSNLAMINVALDGPEQIHNSNRPDRNNRGTFRLILDFMRKVDAKIALGIKCTVNNNNVKYMKDLVEMLHEEHLRITNGINFGIAFYLHGSNSQKEYSYLHHFYDEYKKAEEAGKKYNIPISSVFSMDLRKPHIFHCGANGKTLYVDVNGRVSICPVGNNDDKDNPFVVGQFDEREKRFVLDEKKLTRIQGRSVERMKECQDCFAKYHCAGDCLALSYYTRGSLYKKFGKKCDLFRKFLYDQILHIVDQPFGNNETKELSFLK
jgi:uncharacterized protein